MNLSTQLKKALAQKYFRLTTLVFLILVLVLTTGIILTKQIQKSGEPPIVNPAGKAAFKYYPEGGNAPDFRDGSNGPLEVKMERKGGEVVLSWDKSSKVSVVKIFDLGKIYKLGDQKLIWQIQNTDSKKPGIVDPNKIAYITPPYTVGEKPNGFFISGGNQILKLIKDVRYSIELLAVSEQGIPTLGVYTFTF